MRSNPPLTRDQWQRVEALFNDAVDLSPPEQSVLLDEHCRDDAAVRREVEALLRSDRFGSGGVQRIVSEAAQELIEPTDASGERLGAYRLVRPLQQGGMGQVYVAERADDEYRKQVAVKLIAGAFSTEEERRRFRTERQFLADLEHRHIARLIDGGTRADGAPYLVMEYVDGQPIDRYCDDRRLSIEERLALFRLVCLAVEHAHERRIVHRDLKPPNILVTDDGTPKLLDFGIAKLLESESNAGELPATRRWEARLTPEYASPEQLAGRPVGVASDVYALGVVLYELLTGRRPYDLTGLGAEAILRVVGETEAPPPSRRFRARPEAEAPAAARRSTPTALARRLRGDLDNIVLKALEKDPAGRYASAAELAQDVTRFLAGEPVRARAATPWYRLRRYARRQRLKLSLATAVAVAAAAIGLYGWAVIDADRRVRTLVAQYSAPIGHLPGIAILPFEASGDSEDATVLGDGMTDELITSLSSLSALRVTAFNSVMKYRGDSSGMSAIARELGVRYLVTGKIVRDGDRMSLTASLFDAFGETRQWELRHDQRRLEEIFQIQIDLARKIAASMGVELSEAEQRRLARTPTKQVAAYQAFLQGLSSYGRRSRADNLRARVYFERAVAMDPQFARAWATLANTHRADFANAWSDKPEDSLKRAESLAERALRLDPTIPQVHFVMGLVRREQRRSTDALASATHAVALNPNYADGFVLLATVLCYDGRTENTLALLEKAMGLNPHFSIQYPFHVGQCHFAMERYAEAAAAFEEALDKNPTSPRELLWLAATYALSDRLDDAQWKVEELRLAQPNLSLRRIEPTLPFTRPELLGRMMQGLRRAGVPE